jgi:hypothetical protein
MKRSKITFCGISLKKKSVKEKKKKKKRKEKKKKSFGLGIRGLSLLREPTKGPVERTKNREGRKRKVTGSVTQE